MARGMQKLQPALALDDQGSVEELTRVVAGTAPRGARPLLPDSRKSRKIKVEDPVDLESHLHPVGVLGLVWALLRNPACCPVTAVPAWRSGEMTA